MKKIGVMISAVMVTFSMAAGAQTLDELAEIVRRAADSECQIDKEREDQFLSDRDNQQNLLAQARAENKRELRRGDDLKSEYDRLEHDLAELTTVLQEGMGNLGELFGYVRQASGDIQAALIDYMVSAELTGRGVFL